MESKIATLYFLLSNQRILKHCSLHIILIIIEYLSIFSGSVTSAIQLSNTSEEKNPHLFSLNLISPLWLFRKFTNADQNFYSIPAIIVTVACLIFYYLVPFILFKCKERFKVPVWLISPFINFYDLFFFRYFSIFVMDILTSTFLSLNDSDSDKLLAFFLIIVIAWYLLALIYHVNRYTIWISFQNKYDLITCSKQESSEMGMVVMDYPFDNIFSATYETYFSVIKLLICLNMNYSYLNGIITSSQMWFEILIIVILEFFCFKMLFSILVEHNMLIFSFHFNFNGLRIGLIMFNSLSAIFSLIFITGSTNLVIFIIIQCFLGILTLFLVSVLWLHYLKPLFFKKLFSIPMLIFLLNQNLLIDTNKREITILIQLSKIKHSISCANKGIKCKLCLEAYKTNLKTVQSLFHFVFKQAVIEKNEEQLYYDLIKLLYYYVQKKYYTFFIFVETLLSKYKKTNLSFQLNLIYLKSFFSGETLSKKNEIDYFQQILDLHQYSASLEKTIEALLSFIQLDKYYRKPEQILTISENLRTLNDTFNSSCREINRDEIFSLGINLRNLRESYRYKQVINRYIIESLINSQIDKQIPLDIEGKEEYLALHFQTDNNILLAFPIVQDSDMNPLLFKIISADGLLCKFKNKFLVDIFPSEFRIAGITLFQKCLKNESTYDENTYQSQKTTTKIQRFQSHSRPSFEFIIQNDNNIEHIKLSLIISHCLINNSLIIQGEYLSSYKHILILKRYNNNKMSLHSFGHLLERFLLLNPRWLEKFHSKNNLFRFDKIFQIKPEQNTPIMGCSNFDCLFDYSSYKIWYRKFIRKFIDKMSYSKADEEEIKSNLKVLETKKTRKYQLHFLTIFDFYSNNDNYLALAVGNISGIGDLYTTIRGKNIPNELVEEEFADPCLLRDQFSIASSAHQSSSPSNIAFEQWKIDNHSNNVKDDEQSRQRAAVKRKFGFMIYLLLFFNSLVVILSIMYVIWNTYQYARFNKVYQITTDFKIMRNIVTHSLVSIFSNACIAELNSNGCISDYERYSQHLSAKASLPEGYDINTFLVREVGAKNEKLQDLFQSFRTKLFAFGDQNLINILKLEMNYTILFENRTNDTDELSTITSVIPYEEGVKRYINSLNDITQNEPRFDRSPIYLISTIRGKANLENIYDKRLNPAQREIYHIIMNYPNMIKIFTRCDSAFLVQYNILTTYNSLFTEAFIILIFVFHLFLWLLCLWNIFLATSLVMQYINQMSEKMAEVNFSTYHIAKLENLLLLCKFYSKEPNQLIKSMESQKKKVVNNKIRKSQGDLTEKKEDHRYLQKGVPSYNYDFLIKTYIKYASSIFVCYFSLAVTYSVILLKFSSGVDEAINYVWTNVKIENYIYNNMNILQVMALSNVTESDFAFALGMSTGYNFMNNRIKFVLDNWNWIRQLEIENPNKYKNPSDIISYNCSTMFKQLNDSIIAYTEKQFNTNYVMLLEKICKIYACTHMHDFTLILNEIIFLSQHLLATLNQTDYNSRMNFRKSETLNEINTIILVLFRPFQVFLIQNISLAVVNNALSNMDFIVAGYMAMNICLDIALFIMVRRIIISKLREIIQNLILINDSFKC